MLGVDDQNGQLDERIATHREAQPRPEPEPELELAGLQPRPWPVDAEHVTERDARRAAGTDGDDIGSDPNAQCCDMELELELRLDLKPPVLLADATTGDSCASPDPDGQRELNTHTHRIRAHAARPDAAAATTRGRDPSRPLTARLCPLFGGRALFWRQICTARRRRLRPPRSRGGHTHRVWRCRACVQRSM